MFVESLLNHLCDSCCVLVLGMPFPQNLETAKEVEAVVRNNGAVPATIAILDGIPCIGIHLIPKFHFEITNKNNR